ncbi:MAG: fumarate hydratase [Clostridia bacterium]|nr:fumarate hydratase [Clostridia bacterium]MBQ7289198.1 fumarate hydratase [Clostridia bacterium]
MKEITCAQITATIAEMCIEANKHLPKDVASALERAATSETTEIATSVLTTLRDNVAAAAECDIPICQDTGMAVVFLEIGQEVHITGGSLGAAVQEGVRRGYVEGLLRLSVVRDPLQRVNSQDNTPAILHTEIVDGDEIKITVCPKGFGSENMSGIRMLLPSAGVEGVKKAILDIVRNASSNPCPPMIVGVGIGGDFEMCALLAKKALCRSLDKPNPNPFYRSLEESLLAEINLLGIGPQGFGGQTTALGVNIEYMGTHIAGLPVAVNIGCHVNRHLVRVLR